MTASRLVRALVPAGLLVLSTAQSAVGQDMTPADTIRVLRENSNHAIATHDVPRLIAFFSPDYRATAGNGTQIRSLVELQALLTRRFDEAPELAYVRIPGEIIVSDDGMRAFEVGGWTTLDPQAPPGEVLPEGRYSAMWIRVDGEWRIHSELFTTLAGG
jgi:hypothetical protein